MTREVHILGGDAAAWYSGILTEAAKVLPTSLAVAEELIAPIANEVWMGTLPLHGKTEPGADERSSRRPSNRIRAQVFLRDGFICTYCGGRTIPRCILVALSDVFPDALPYDTHYRRGGVHPVYWALAPEADHKLAHSHGGSNDIDNLTTLHAMCNTQKSSLAIDALPILSTAAATANDWNGLLPRYADIVIAGNVHGHRHSAASYHPDWLSHFNRPADAARVRASVAALG